MFFPLRSNLPTTSLTAAHHASRLALTLVASLLLAACGSSTPTPATPTPTPLLAPNISDVSLLQTYTQNTDITPLVFDNTGGDVTDGTAGCAVDRSDGKPALPMGLNVGVVMSGGKRTCRITGMPAEVVSTARVVTITATNTTESDSATVSIIVNPAATPLLAPNISDVSLLQTYTQNTEITPLVFDNTGGDVTDGTAGCAVDRSDGKPALPMGLNVGVVMSGGKRTCRITGMPAEVVSTARVVTITATNTTESDSATVSIIVHPAAPILQAPVGTQSYSTDATVSLVLTNTGGDVAASSGCMVDDSGDKPDLPMGLDVEVVADANDNGKMTCRIFGTPDTAAVATDYEITATNITGSDSVTVSIAVISGIASFTDPGALVYAVGDNVNVNFINTSTMGGRVTDCVVPAGVTLPAGLMINVIALPASDNGCTLTGTANVITAQASYTITAKNDIGDASLTLDITVNPAAPDLREPAAQIYTTDTQVSLVLTNDGGDVTASTGCGVDTSGGKPGLPMGLDVEVAPDANDNGKMTCRIFGTPTAVTPAADYVITATNITNTTNDIEPSSVTVNITVNPAAPNLREPAAQIYTTDTQVSLVLTNTGGDVTAGTGCGVDTSGGKPGLPMGLDVEVAPDANDNGKMTCRIFGTPTAVTPAADYVITATNITNTTNASNPSSVTVSITVNLAAPTLGAVSAQAYAANTAIPDLILTNTGGDVAASSGCTVTTSVSNPNGLPMGLDVEVVTANGKETCQITGIPTELVSPARMVTITATNTGGSDTATVSITVHAGIMPVGSSAENLFRYEVGRTVPDTREITFTNAGDTIAGGDIQSCTASDLPMGMRINSINTADCTISGEPSRITAETTPHTITATYTNGTTSVVMISIETYLSAPPSLSDYSGVTLVVGSTVGLPIVLQNTGGPVGANGCEVILDSSAGQQALSNFGLALAVTSDSSSCEIRATGVALAAPTAIVEETGYRIRATNNLGVSGAVATLTIIAASETVAAPTLTAPAGSPFTFATNAAIAPIMFTVSDSGLGICTISPALPAGLRLDPSNCQISGTPRTASAMATYTVTATNKTTPAATASVVITVTNTVTPSLESMVTLGLTMNSNAGLPFAIANTGGSPTSCADAPVTPTDALASYNLAVTAADGTCVIDSLDGNGPSRALDGGSFTITPSGGAASTLTLNLRSPATPQIVAGNSRTYAINSGRQLFGWGSNEANRLGFGDLDDFLPFISTPALLTANDWAQVDSGSDHTCAINASGQLWCWGRGSSGQLGLGDSNDRNRPTQVGIATNWMQVSAGQEYTCAINTSGHLFCWGLGARGQLGLGAGTVIINRPMRVGGASGASDWAQVSAGGSHSCAINTSGALFCWGHNGTGQLGLGDTNDRNTPTKVGDAEDWRQVSAGSSHTCATKGAGELWCWGNGSFGQLGLDNTNFATNTPTQVGGASGATNWTQVSAGEFHTCAIKGDGELWCWGAGANGQLGLGDIDDNEDDVIDNADTPTRVGTAMDWTQVSAGNQHTCAINTSGQPWCWGNGADGRLGTGSNTNRSTPTLIPGLLLR